jgi:hypothetical protein
MIVRRKVDESGRITELEDLKNSDVIVVRTPSGVTSERAERFAKAFEKPLAAFEDVLRFVKEHRDLTVKQVDEFTARYGNPADKAREYAKGLSPEEFRARVNEVNALVEKRLETISKDLERRYDELEREVETAIERVFGAGKKGPSEVAKPTREVDVAPMNGNAAPEKPPAKPEGKPASGSTASKSGGQSGGKSSGKARKNK